MLPWNRQNFFQQPEPHDSAPPANEMTAALPATTADHRIVAFQEAGPLSDQSASDSEIWFNKNWFGPGRGPAAYKVQPNLCAWLAYRPELGLKSWRHAENTRLFDAKQSLEFGQALLRFVEAKKKLDKTATSLLFQRLNPPKPKQVKKAGTNKRAGKMDVDDGCSDSDSVTGFCSDAESIASAADSSCSSLESCRDDPDEGDVERAAQGAAHDDVFGFDPWNAPARVERRARDAEHGTGLRYGGASGPCRDHPEPPRADPGFVLHLQQWFKQYFAPLTREWDQLAEELLVLYREERAAVEREQKSDLEARFPDMFCQDPTWGTVSYRHAEIRAFNGLRVANVHLCGGKRDEKFFMEEYGLLKVLGLNWRSFSGKNMDWSTQINIYNIAV